MHVHLNDDGIIPVIPMMMESLQCRDVLALLVLADHRIAGILA
jgi:hypothetical protein